MKIGIISDVHLEFYENRGKKHPELMIDDGIDVLVCAGDIHVGCDGLEWMASVGKPVIYVLGNHEFYNGIHSEVLEDVRMTAKKYSNVTILENEYVDIEDVRLIGGTMWTDFESGGNTRTNNMDYAEGAMSDFQIIEIYEDGVPRPLYPRDTIEFFNKTKSFIEESIIEGKKNVVVTHHLPHLNSVPIEYKFSPLNGAFVSDLSEIMESHKDLTWIHGHSHDAVDYQVGDTRVVSNPIGYFGHEHGRERVSVKVIEV